MAKKKKAPENLYSDAGVVRKADVFSVVVIVGCVVMSIVLIALGICALIYA